MYVSQNIAHWVYGNLQHQKFHKNIFQYERMFLGYLDTILHGQLRKSSQLCFQNPKGSK